MKKRTNTLLLITILLLVVIMTLTATYAIWLENPGESKYLRFDIEDENPSVKYQIYVPLNAEGERLEGSLDILAREYTLNNSADISLIDGYGLVGWDGGINITRLEIPSTYSMIIKDEGGSTYQIITKPPVAVLVLSEFAAYHCTNNNVIEEIEIPQNIVLIENGAFILMSSLKSVLFTGDGYIEASANSFEPTAGDVDILWGGRTTVLEEPEEPEE